VANVEQIARDEHARHGLSYDDCLTYLRDHLHFTLGPRELAGLRSFERHLAGIKLGPGGLRHEAVPVNTATTFGSGWRPSS
jgi:chorismate dehydratase